MPALSATHKSVRVGPLDRVIAKGRCDRMSPTTSAPTTNKKLIDWGGRVQRWPVRQREWCDGSADEYDRLCRLLVTQGRSPASTRPSVPIATGCPLTGRRGTGRGPTYICSAEEIDAGRPNNGGNPRRCGRPSGGFFEARCGAGPCTCPVLDGPARVGTRRTSGAAHPTRRPVVAVDADHDPDGPGRPRGARVQGRVRAVPALGRGPARARPGRCRVAVRATTSTSSTSRDPGDHLVRSGYGGNALLGQEMLRASHRVGDRPRRRLVAEHMLILKLTSPEARRST